jgi:hypothetical protein
VRGARPWLFRHRLVLTGCVAGLLLALQGCAAEVRNTPQFTVSAGVPQAVDGSGNVGLGPEASPPQRISYPAAGMDITVHVFEPDDDAVASRGLVPPETMDGYWLASFGSPGAGSTNTTYVIGHTWVGRDAPFNQLSTASAPGDRLTVQTATGSLGYQVDTVATYTKSTLKDSAIWTVVPNSLVLISCYSEDPWGKNVVVVASPVPARP